MDKELNVLLQAMRTAGEAIVNLQTHELIIQKKSNNDLLTMADLRVNQILQTELLTHFPKDGWLSEETADDYKRLQCARTWVIDPIDGTKEFINGIPEYAISAALVEHDSPIVAAIYNPAKQELFYAYKEGGAWLNDKRIFCKVTNIPRYSVLASRSEVARGEWKKYLPIFDVTAVGSIAYKLACMAAGYADATFSLSPKNEWDIAAGVLLVEEAGGKCTTTHGKTLLFNQQNTLLDGIIATTHTSHDDIMTFIANINETDHEFSRKEFITG